VEETSQKGSVKGVGELFGGDEEVVGRLVVDEERPFAVIDDATVGKDNFLVKGIVHGALFVL